MITRLYVCELQAWPPGDSVYPDYTNPRTVEWWTQLCLEFKDVLDYDGIWIVCLIIFASLLLFFFFKKKRGFDPYSLY